MGSEPGKQNSRYPVAIIGLEKSRFFTKFYRLHLPRISGFCLRWQLQLSSHCATRPTKMRNRVAISAATYRGAKCPTLKTAEKQPKRVPSGSR